MLNKWPQKLQYNPAIYCTTFLCVDNKSIDYNPGNQRGGDLFRPFHIAFCSFVWTWQWLYFRRYWLIFKDWNSSCPLYYFTLMLGLYLITLKWQMEKKMRYCVHTRRYDMKPRWHLTAFYHLNTITTQAYARP